MTCHCARPRCNATPSDTLRTAFFTPRTPHFTLALHLNSSHPSCSYLISCLLKCQLSCSWLFSFYLRTWQQNIATFMQPFQCDLQRGVPQPHRTTHTQRHAKCRNTKGEIGRTKKHQNERTRNRLTHELPFTAACSYFTRKNTRFRAPASSPTQAPCNSHAAIPMRSATRGSTTA